LVINAYVLKRTSEREAKEEEKAREETGANNIVTQ